MAGYIQVLSGVSLADQAYEMIRGAILEGELRPRERFTIEEMAARLGISRTPVREALKALQGDGFVRLLPHRGAMVETYAHDEIEKRYVIKAMLEGYAAELACQIGDKELPGRLSRNCEKLEALCAEVGDSQPEDVRAFMALNAEFHGMIREASKSKTLIRLLDSLRQPSTYSVSYWRRPEARQASMKAHRAIAEAIGRCDRVEARACTQRHLLEANERIRAHFDEVGTGDAESETDALASPRKHRSAVAGGGSKA